MTATRQVRLGSLLVAGLAVASLALATPRSAGASSASVATSTAARAAANQAAAPCVRDDGADTRYVRALYATFAGRASTPAEEGLWRTAFRTQGIGIDAPAKFLSVNTWFLRGTVATIYTALLHRSPDASGSAAWTAALAYSNVPAVTGRIASSTEYWQRNGSSVGGFVNGLYHDVLGRAPDAGGLAAWTNEISRGHRTRAVVATRFDQSAESRLLRAARVYPRVLDRTADTGGLANAAAQLNAIGESGLAAMLASSQEFWNRAQIAWGGTAGQVPKACPKPDPIGAVAGHTIVLDPGHNGLNWAHPEIINRQVPDGTGTKPCDTTGTATNGGYAEHAFTFDVATRLAALLRSHGATVVVTRPNDSGVGPCVNDRAAIGNRNAGAVGVSIHADGGPATARGFHVIRPGGIPGLNTAIVGPSSRLATALRDAYRSGTGEPAATYVGATDGIVARNDLGGLNLSTIPKVFIETLNMRQANDAARATDPAFRQQAAQAIANGLGHYFGG